MSVVFSLKNISKTYGDDTVFENLTIDFKLNEQLGLIGMNGSGKSTLLKLIAGKIEPDGGEVAHRSGFRCVYLPQTDVFPQDKSVEQILYDRVNTVSMDEKERHKTVQTFLGKGGFENPRMMSSHLSGGWQKKLAVIRALCSKPDILLLDEPTNHLDIDGVLWLEGLLKGASFSFIVVSHDRAFLENTCLATMEVGRFYPKGYFKVNGPYTKFQKERRKVLEAQQNRQASLTSKMRREDAWLRQGAKARTTKAKYRIEQAEMLRSQLADLRQKTRETVSVGLDFHGTGRQSKKLLTAFYLEKSINSQPLFSDISLELGPGNCLGIIGANGSGKSTLLSILAGETKPDNGKIRWVEQLKTALFDQHRSKLDPASTLREALNPEGGDSVHYNGRSVHMVTWAKRFLFMPDQLDMKVDKLSGGEKAKILLANIMRTPCDILFLDEPTNDLDIISLEVLEESILKFPGAVVIVSHDRFLMDRVCQQILYLDDQGSGVFCRDINQVVQYRQGRQQKKKSDEVNKTKKQKLKKPSGVLFTYKEKYELEHIEEKILVQEDLIEKHAAAIQIPDIITDPEQMREHCRELEKAQEKADYLYERWEYLEAKKPR